MTTITLHSLPPSPNTHKVKIGLGFKSIEFTEAPFSFDKFPGDRSPLAKISRQPFLPMIEHGSVVIFGAGEILRYLEANFPETPPLFSTDYAEMRAIEDAESYARSQVSEAIGLTFGQAMADEPDLKVTRQACEVLNKSTEQLETRLGRTEFLVGERLTAADVVTAPYVKLGMLEQSDSHDSPIHSFFCENLLLGSDRDRTRAWVERVYSFCAD